MYAGTPTRRNLGEPWFVPIARVGTYGSEEYVLTSSDATEGMKPRETMTSVIAPRKNGELFLFVNDAYSGLFPLAWLESTLGRRPDGRPPSLRQQFRHRHGVDQARGWGRMTREMPRRTPQTMSASRVSSDSTRHQCGSKSAPSGQTLSL